MALIPLHADWTLTAVSGPVPPEVAGRVIAVTVPGCAHTDLHSAGLIPDPFDGDNEAAQQWIGSTVWRYSTRFDWSDDGSARHDLVALGLDTVATIELNGRIVARTENQHRSYRFDVGALLVAGSNELVITFASPVDEVEARDVEHGPRPHVNHHPYNALRKAAYNFGWDWGIDAATSGIWQPIGLESWSGVRIDSVRPLVGLGSKAAADAAGSTTVQEGTDASLRDGLLDARIALEWADASAAPLDAAAPAAAPVEVTVAVGGQRRSVLVAPGTVEARVEVTVPAVDVWWPAGHGAQPLYDIEVTVAGAAEPWRSRVGFRTVHVDTAPDEIGAPFDVYVNDELVQVRGANWIPEHAFLTELDRDRYRRRVADAVDANMNLLRVWGGGIYESDDFYDACDEAGILVWQDFLFACAAYAEEEWLAVEVEAEAREAITRLSPHPSLIIWNGNNENIWGYVEWGWRRALAGRTWGNGYYRELLPGLVAELDPSRAYSPASPYSFTEYLYPNHPDNGTMHIWDVWNSRDYTAYAEHRPRFVSEFGFQGPPAWSTLVGAVHDEPLEPYGAQLLVHQKAEDGNLKLERGMRGHLPEPRTFEDWHWATQLNQAAAVRFGLRHFRSIAPRNTGAIVWQLNDSWPVVSWAAVDFDEHRKPLWYALRDAYAPRLATFQPVAGAETDAGAGTDAGALALVLLNDTGREWSGTVVLRRAGFDGAVLAEARIAATVAARGSASVPVPAELAAFGDVSREILLAEFEGAAGTGDTGFARAIHDPAEVVDQALDAHPLSADAREVAEATQAADASDSAEAGEPNDTASAADGAAVYLVTVTARSYTRDSTLLVDKVDSRARVDRGLVTLLAGESATFRVTARPGLDPAAFTTDAVLRHA